MTYRPPSTDRIGRPFDAATIEAVWQKGRPDGALLSFRLDSCGASMGRDRYGKTELWGWEIDHIKPVSKGGTDDLYNLQPLQWENNRTKSDTWPEQWTCKIRV